MYDDFKHIMKQRSLPAQLEAEAYKVKQIIRQESIENSRKERRSYVIESFSFCEKDDSILEDSNFGRG